MNPEEVAPIAIDGLLKRKEVIIPGSVNKLFLVLNKLIPASLKKVITNNQMKLLNAVPPRFRPAYIVGLSILDFQHTFQPPCT